MAVSINVCVYIAVFQKLMVLLVAVSMKRAVLFGNYIPAPGLFIAGPKTNGICVIVVGIFQIGVQ